MKWAEIRVILLRCLRVVENSNILVRQRKMVHTHFFLDIKIGLLLLLVGSLGPLFPNSEFSWCVSFSVISVLS